MLRVTQVLSLFQNLWKIPQDILERKAKVGTDVHLSIFEYLVNRVPPENGYVRSFAQWYKEPPVPTIARIEETVIDEELGLKGTPDLILDRQGKMTLIDFKTSVKDDPVCWRLQGTAYIRLLQRSGLPIDNTFYFLKLDKEGKWPGVFCYQATDEGWETFLKALDCARYFQKWKGTLPELE